MTAMTETLLRNDHLTPEVDKHVVVLTGSSEFSYTPANTGGKTVRVLSCVTSAGTVINTSISAGVITIDSPPGAGTAFGGSTVFHLTYALM